MTPTPEIVQRVAREFARSVADRPETAALHVSVDEDEDAIVLWLETDGSGTATEADFHEITAQINDRYPDAYILLRILDPARSGNPRGVLPAHADQVSVQEMAREINGAEDTRPL